MAKHDDIRVAGFVEWDGFTHSSLQNGRSEKGIAKDFETLYTKLLLLFPFQQMNVIEMSVQRMKLYHPKHAFNSCIEIRIRFLRFYSWIVFGASHIMEFFTKSMFLFKTRIRSVDGTESSERVKRKTNATGFGIKIIMHVFIFCV